MKLNKVLFHLILLCITLLYNFQIESFAQELDSKKFEIKSSAFENNEMIPKLYTCDGNNISPSIIWTSVPNGTKSLALICDDPDAPSGTWVHWVIYNIRPSPSELPTKVLSQIATPFGAKQGINDFQKIGYGGPCPPNGTHRYFFKLYALDTKLDLSDDVTKDQLLNAIEGHVLGKTELIGKYTKQK